MFTEEQIDAALAENELVFRQAEARHKKQRDLLLELKRVITGEHQPAPAPKPKAKPAAKVVSRAPVEPGHPLDEMSNRDIVRHFVLETNGEFTLNDLMDKARLSGSGKAQELDRMSWSSSLWSFAKQGLLEEVAKRKGNKAATYRRLSDDMAPPPSEKESAFPLTELVKEAVSALEMEAFGRVDVLEKIKALHPEHTGRVTADTVGAILNRESRYKGGPFAVVERSNLGNIYKRVPKS